MVDQQEALERQRELYQEKNEHLVRFLEPVAPYEFYREIFPEGSFERKGHFEDRKGNGIAVTVQKVEVDKATGIALQIEGDGKAKRCTITDELDELRELQDTDFTIMSPISYFGLRRCGKNARYLLFSIYFFPYLLIKLTVLKVIWLVRICDLSDKTFVLPLLTHTRSHRLPEFRR